MTKEVSLNDIPVSTFGLRLSSYAIEKPAPKTSYIDIPFGDGSADLSMASGEMKYGMRKLSMILQGIMRTNELEALSTSLANMLHGQKVKIRFDSDPDYYYYGRVSVAYLKAKAIGEIVLEALCEPYKYRCFLLPKALKWQEVTSNLTNDRMRAYPKITTSAAFTVTKDGVTYSYETVSDQQTIIPLLEGENELILTGTGTITFEWQEGAL
jgi:phage-related protein